MISNWVIILVGTVTPSLIYGLFTQGPIAASLSPLFSRKGTTRLGFTNLHLEGVRFWLLFAYFIFGSIKRRLGLGTAVQLIVKDGATKDDPSAQRVYKGDRITLYMPFAITPLELRAYAASVGFDDKLDAILEVPSHLQLFLAAATAPAMVLLLAKSNCPVDPIGSVNVRNRFELPSPEKCAELLKKEMLQPDEKLVLYASLDKEVAVVKRGYEYRIVVELRDDTELLFRQAFTTLVFAKHGLKVEPKPTSEPAQLTTIGETVTILPMDPAKWAFLSRDYNPIHLHGFAAKLMGFQRRIAHGNHVVAKALEAERKHAGTKKAAGSGKAEQWTEVEFLRPTFVPSDLEVRAGSAAKGETQLEVRVGDKVNAVVRHS